MSDDTPITREELLEELRKLHGADQDHEGAHIRADDLLLDYINDDEITKAFDEIVKWYA